MSAGYLGAYLGTGPIVDPDTTAPTIVIVSPTPGVDPGAPGGFPLDWNVARMTPIIVRITDALPGNVYQCVVARYAGIDNELVVYRRGQFRGAFSGLSTAVAITDGIELSILPFGGWPSSSELVDVVLELDTFDAAGNLGP